MSIDWSKPVQTRDGRKVRILCTDRVGGLYPIVGLLIEGNIENTHCWTRTGCSVVGEHGSPRDLINVPPPKRKTLVTVRLYRCPQLGVYPAVAMEGQSQPWASDFIAQQFIEMEYEEPQS